MSEIEELLAQIPTDQIAGRLGVDQQTARSAIQQALPALVGGLHANAQDPARAASLAGALAQHDPSLTDGGVDLDQVDAQDGDRIVGHVFGGHRDAVVQQLGGTGSPAVDSNLISKLLPLLAPIVMSFLAKRLLGGGGAGGIAGGSTGSGGLGDILGGLLKGSASGSGGQGSGGQGSGGQGSGGGLDLGSILGGLGGLLGGGRR